jgi:hypothetical protein
VGSEFFINSQELEEKVRKLLPSQGGAGSGFDLSASSQIIPIIDLTESAEGSNLRQDLQSSLSLSTSTSFEVSNTSSTIINNTGYFRIFGTATLISNVSGSESVKFDITDGTTTKSVYKINLPDTAVETSIVNYDFIIFLEAGESCVATSTNVSNFLTGSTRQIASIDGSLTNP